MLPVADLILLVVFSADLGRVLSDRYWTNRVFHRLAGSTAGGHSGQVGRGVSPLYPVVARQHLQRSDARAVSVRTVFLRANNAADFTGVVAGIIVITGMTLPQLVDVPEPLRNPMNSILTIVVGMLTIFLLGALRVTTAE